MLVFGSYFKKYFLSKQDSLCIKQNFSDMMHNYIYCTYGETNL